MTRARVFGFDWSFIDEVCRWAVAVAIGIAAIGSAVTSSPWFAIACIGAAAIDIGLVAISVRRARAEMEAGRIDTVAPMVMLAGRLLVKLVLLLVAFATHESAIFAGAIAGVLVFDLTLALGGSAIALSRGLRRPREGG